GAEEERSETARLSSFVGAIASLGVDNPAAKILVNMSKTQDDEVGDGTTSVTVLAAELLREAEQMMAHKLHPQTIISGWRKACDAARHGQVPRGPHEHCPDYAEQQAAHQHRDHFAELAVNAILRLKGSGNLEAIQLIKKLGGLLHDSYLDEGFLLDKKIGAQQPKRIEKAKVLIANTPMDSDKIKVFGSKIKVDAVAKLSELELAEKQKMKAKVEKIVAHGCNVFINRQLIYNYPEQLFSDAGVVSIEHATFEGIERLALVLGGEIVSTFDSPGSVKLGECDLIEEVMIGEDKLIRMSGVPLGEACTIVLRGATQQILDEADRSLHDALCVLQQTVQDSRVICGGGCAEALMAVLRLAAQTAGKEAIAMEAFARALLQLPTAIADNGGYDSSDLVAQIRASHVAGQSYIGLNMTDGVPADMRQLGITESLRVKRQVLLSAAEAAEMILRVDDILKASPRPRRPEH
uniref:T-complex protein 1 subunit beta n=1 Tax=Macrostomum lignano TaxID=282301 RepID=A0A1I8FS88_9PLAT